jgi:hypothetical protein
MMESFPAPALTRAPFPGGSRLRELVLEDISFLALPILLLSTVELYL